MSAAPGPISRPAPSVPRRASRARRAVAATLAVVAVAFVAVACGDPASDLPGSEGAASDTTPPTLAEAGAAPTPVLPVTVDSADGRTVTVTDVSRIVPLQGNLAEIVFDLGLGDRVVGRDVSATFAEAEDLPLVTRAHDVSAESVLSVRPTVVLVDSETGPEEAIDHLRNVGIPVVEVERPTEIGDIGPRIRAVAAALGVPEAGDALARRTEAAVDAAADRAPEGSAPTVAFLYVRGSAGVYLIGGPGSGVDAMITAAGGVDAGTEIGLSDPFTPITSEALVEAAPDVLLLTTTGLESVGGVDGLLELAGVAQTPAGRSGRIVTMEDGLLFSFGSRTPAALESLAEEIHGAGTTSGGAR